jgi:hypothetical protein
MISDVFVVLNPTVSGRCLPLKACAHLHAHPPCDPEQRPVAKGRLRVKVCTTDELRQGCLQPLAYDSVH